MKNTLTINANEGCICECLDKIDDGTNLICINVITYTEGVLEFVVNSETIVEPVTGEPFEVPEEWYLTADLQFRFVDEYHTGDYFILHAPTTTKGDMWISQVEGNQFEYDIRFYEPSNGGGEYTLPPATTTTLGGVIVGDGLSVKKDGTLSADAQKIDVDDALSDKSTNPVQNKVITARLDEVFQSVSDGKTAIAGAITDKGVYTGNGATFDQMASNIMRINQNGAGGVNVFLTDRAVVFEDLNELIGCEVSIERTIRNIIPNMTSNEYTDGNGNTYVASYSTRYSEYYDAFRAFDGDTSRFWAHGTGETTLSSGRELPCWIQIELPRAVAVRRYSLRGAASGEYPKSWILKGSNDGTNFTNLDTQPSSTLLSNQITNDFDISIDSAYKFYRLYITDSTNYCGVSVFNLGY